MNINLGGQKGWKNYGERIKREWSIMDCARGSDVVYDLNSGEKFLLKDNSVSNYYTSHTLEHVQQKSLVFVFQELYRTLTPGGKIRIVVPDFKYGVYLYDHFPQSLIRSETNSYPYPNKHTPPTPLGNLMSWWSSPDRKDNYSGHQVAFDFETLVWYLRTVGFKTIDRKNYNNCSEIFRGLDFSRYANWSLYIEAEK